MQENNASWNEEEKVLIPPADQEDTDAFAEGIDQEEELNTAEAHALQSQLDQLMDDGGGSGDISLDKEFLKNTPRHRIWFFAFMLVGFVLSMMWGYYFDNKRREIDQLEKRLEDIRYRYLFTTAELVRIQRISSIEERVRELGLPLEHSTKPPYKIILSQSSQE